MSIIYNKDNPDFKFSYLKEYNIDKIKQYLKSFDNEWLIDTSRQDTFEVHRFTNSYILNKVDIFGWAPGDKYNGEFICNDEYLWSLVFPIVKELEEIRDGKVGQALFIKLSAGKIIDPHEDSGDYLYVVSRHHIPIITNPKVGFIVGGQTQHMKEGECWEINNNKEHSVFNEGDEDRIHLLIDIIPNKFLG
jgi:quercetin dioxygenase-like cupin family protein